MKALKTLTIVLCSIGLICSTIGFFGSVANNDSVWGIINLCTMTGSGWGLFYATGDES